MYQQILNVSLIQQDITSLSDLFSFLSEHSQQQINHTSLFPASFCEDCCHSSCFGLHPPKGQLEMHFLYKLSSSYTMPHMILAASFSCGCILLCGFQTRKSVLMAYFTRFKTHTVFLFCKCIHIFFSIERKSLQARGVSQTSYRLPTAFISVVDPQ